MDKKYIRWGVALVIGLMAGANYLGLIPTEVYVTVLGLLTGGALAYKPDGTGTGAK
jgi:hypothetical protein